MADDEFDPELAEQLAGQSRATDSGLLGLHTQWGPMASPNVPSPATPPPAAEIDPSDEAFALLNEAVSSSRAKQDRVAGQMDESYARSREIEASRRAQMDPLYAQAIERMNQPRPPTPNLMPPDKAPPANNYAQIMQEWVPAMAVVALLAGSLGRKSATTALTAFGAGIQGAAQGNMQEFERNFRIWKAETDNAIRRSELQLRQYEAVLRSDELDIERKRSTLMLIAQQWGAQADYETLRQKGLNEFARNLQQHEFHLERLRVSTQNAELRHQAQIAKIEATAAKAGLAGGVGRLNTVQGLEWLARQPEQLRPFYIWAFEVMNRAGGQQISGQPGPGGQGGTFQSGPRPPPPLPGDRGFDYGPGFLSPQQKSTVELLEEDAQ